MRCFSALLALSLVLTITVLFVFSDSHPGPTPASTPIQGHANQIHWQQPGLPQWPGPVQVEAYQVRWQRLRPLQSEGIEWAERINEQMMRQRSRTYLQRLTELR